MPEQGEEDYLSKRVPEALGHTYAIHWPFYQYESARGVRRSAIHEQLKERGACFGEAACWERANWFAEPGSTPKYEYSYGPQNWFENSAAEHKAIREGVGLYDVSSFAKFRVQGPDALAVLLKVSGNDIDVAPGRLVYTQWLNERAGIEADLTIARMGEDEFAVLTGCGSHVRDLTWLKRHSADAKVDITDVTHDFTVLALQGPKSRDVMERLTDADVSAEAMPFSTAKYVEINGAQVWIQRISYVGELGWEVLIPVADAVNVLEEIERQGDPLRR
jgi:4-methylaminobutanoate oxidase (formaldehyde-forming)